MKRPLLPVACLLIGGILFGEWARPPLPLLFAASFAAAAAALAWNRARHWLLGLLLFLTGWTGACRNTAILSPLDLRLSPPQWPRWVTLRGVIREPPSQRVYQRDRRESWRSSALIETEEMSSDGLWQPVAGTVIAGLPGILPAGVFEGQRVEVSGVLQPPHGPSARGMFNPRAFYYRENVFFQLQTSSPDDWKTFSPTSPFSERFRQWARRTLALGLPEEDEPLRLTWTLLLDWKAPLTGSVEEPFLRAGTYHIFAVDGLRIGLLAAIGMGLLRLLRLPRPLCGALVLPVLWFYVALTGWPASAARAAIMASVLIIGWASRRPMDLLNSLFAAAVIILLWNPAQLFQPGFQLSFLVVLCIGLILPRVRLRLRGWLFQDDPLLPAALQPRLPAWLYTPAAGAVDTFAMSVAAWLGSIPLAAYYFHLFTPVSIPANCVVVPATALALASGMGSLLAGSCLPGLAGLFNNATWALMKFIIWFSRCAAQWPAGNYNVPAPSTAACAFYYLVLLLAVSGWIFRSRHKRTAAAALLAAGLAIAAHEALAWRTTRLDILPLNGSTVIFAPASGPAENLLINCGNEAYAANLIKPFLCAQGVNHLDALCLAVERLDCFGGAALILSNFPASAILSGTAQNRSAASHNLARKLSQYPGWRTVSDGDIVSGWSVLHPGPSDQFTQADDNALVLRRDFNGHSILLLPALGRDGQNALIQRHPDLRAECVIAGLPVRDEPLCEPLLDMLRPRLIVIADARFPATRRATPQLRQRLARRDARVVYTRDNGALTLEPSPTGWSPRAADGQPALDPPP